MGYPGICCCRNKGPQLGQGQAEFVTNEGGNGLRRAGRAEGWSGCDSRVPKAGRNACASRDTNTQPIFPAEHPAPSPALSSSVPGSAPSRMGWTGWHRERRSRLHPRAHGTGRCPGNTDRSWTSTSEGNFQKSSEKQSSRCCCCCSQGI